MCAVIGDRRLFLVGARAAGKTTVGRLLAARLGLPFVDTDAVLVEREARSVSDIVQQEGWSAFRQKEGDVLRQVIQSLSVGGVIATGGGIVLARENRELLRSCGTVVYLRASAEELASRLASNALAEQRPSLTGRPLLEEVDDVLRERDPLYVGCAHYVVDATKDIETVCTQIVQTLRLTELLPQTRF
ncbi:MAG: shikimate kinase AroL [Desulfovibrio sp.]|nr:shikimate kinase AroL [Desulfovibrio sp.]